jgi:hypothetical protein
VKYVEDLKLCSYLGLQCDYCCIPTYRATPVAYRGGFADSNPPPKFRSFDKSEPDSQFRGKHICNNLIRKRVPLICKLSGTPDKGLPSPDPCSLCPLSSAEFVETPLRIKFLGTPLDYSKAAKLTKFHLALFHTSPHKLNLQNSTSPYFTHPHTN